jgi:hypothetical protein
MALSDNCAQPSEKPRSPFILKLEHGAEPSDRDRQVLELAIREVRQFHPRSDLIRSGIGPNTFM